MTKDYAALARTPLKLEPVTLTGRHLRLEPLCIEHVAALAEAGADPAIWTWYPQSAHGPERMRAWVQQALDWQASGVALPFVQVDVTSGRVIGSTRFGAIEASHRRAEIGWTWLNPAFQRSAANTESKYLMLCHAFETLGLVRVEFKTDSGNQASRRALARIGGHLPQPHDRGRRPPAALGVLQHHRQRLAGGEGRPGTQTGVKSTFSAPLENPT